MHSVIVDDDRSHPLISVCDILKKKKSSKDQKIKKLDLEGIHVLNEGGPKNLESLFHQLSQPKKWTTVLYRHSHHTVM